jgi:penicillin-binding protein 2
MFERRLRLFLLIIFALGAVLVGRAMQVQLVQASHWQSLAEQSMRRGQLIETTRGRILDARGKVLATDAPCIDVCVDYRALTDPPDEKWIRGMAIRRLRVRSDEYRLTDALRRRELITQEMQQVLSEIDAMWNTLARLGGTTRAEIDATRREIVKRVELRRRTVVLHRYQQAVQEKQQKSQDRVEPWYRSWLVDESSQAPQLEDFDVTLAEQNEAHVILRNVDNATHVQLEKQIGQYPGLVLRPGVKRQYPYGAVAAHVIGRLSRVTADDLRGDPNLGDQLRQYYPNDLIGRVGLESLGEQRLRGVRGQVERDVVSDRVLASNEPAQGRDIRTTLDIELQATIEQAFRQVKIVNPDNTVELMERPGAAVVIDLASGEVRALVSYPTYDLNEFDRLYPKLVADDLNRPLMNRATQFAMEPGSTVKPLVGISAITDGLIPPDGTIECTGYLVLDGRTYSYGRCWTMSMFGRTHQFGSAPHPDGHLSFTDAVERSCNVFFETLGDRLGVEGLSRDFRKFGLGRRTGIGLAEARGLLPDERDLPLRNLRGVSWFAAIGQDQIAVTPLQIANAVATIARRGVWVRPTLIPRGDPQPPTAADDDRPERLDLKLHPQAIESAIAGMQRVVNSPAGTGTVLKRDDVFVAGKTGSAQAARLSVPVRDADGQRVKILENGRERPAFQTVAAGTRGAPNPAVPWYRYTGKHDDELTHAWYVGFVPADNPRVAFAAFVEYGGSGGTAAASVAQAIVEACIEHGYVPRDTAAPPPQPGPTP